MCTNRRPFQTAEVKTFSTFHAVTYALPTLLMMRPQPSECRRVSTRAGFRVRVTVEGLSRRAAVGHRDHAESLAWYLGPPRPARPGRFGPKSAGPSLSHGRPGPVAGAALAVRARRRRTADLLSRWRYLNLESSIRVWQNSESDVLLVMFVRDRASDQPRHEPARGPDSDVQVQTKRDS